MNIFRNPDFREVILEENGKVLLQFAIANGFRNIQNLVQKMKRGKNNYHYVEVMACPSGILPSEFHAFSCMTFILNNEMAADFIRLKYTSRTVVVKVTKTHTNTVVVQLYFILHF